MVDV
jgi:arginine and glutamate-rich protein 1